MISDHDDHNDDDELMILMTIMEYWVVGQAPLVGAQPPVIVVIHTCQAHATDHHRYDDGGGYDDGYWDVGQANLRPSHLWSSTFVGHSKFAHT